MVSKEDMDLVHEYIIYDVLFKFLTSEMTAVENSTIKLKRFHTQVIQDKMWVAHIEFKEVQNNMRQRNIKIHNIEKNQDYRKYYFSCRGYYDSVTVWKKAVRNKVVEKLEILYKGK